MPWYLLCHKAGLDNFQRACKSIQQRENIRLLNPMITIERKRHDRPSARLISEPLFYSYLFVELDFEETHSSVLEDFPGVSHFVRSGPEIKPVSQDVITEIMALPPMQSEAEAYLRARQRRGKAGLDNLKNRILQIASISERKYRSAMFLALFESANH